MDAIEEIINIPILLERLNKVVAAGRVPDVIQEIIIQSRIEFNYAAQDEVGEEDDADLIAALEDDDA